MQAAAGPTGRSSHELHSTSQYIMGTWSSWSLVSWRVKLQLFIRVIIHVLSSGCF